MQPKLLAIEKLKPHPRNPRLAFREDVIAGIAAGLNGEMSPEHSLRVRPVEDGYFEIVSGHQRWQAGLRRGLKELPCWVSEMTDDEAYMSLVTDNTQGELSPLEYGIHAFRIGKGNKWSGPKGKAYAALIGKEESVVSKLKTAAEVAININLQNCNLTDKHWHLYAIHPLPRSLWPDFVTVMLVKRWSVDSTQQAVTKAKGYLEDPITGHEFLPANQCALAIAIGNKSALQLSMLAHAAGAVALYLEKENPEKVSEWLAWLAENMGVDSWDLAKLEAKSAEFMPRSAGPVIAFKTIKEFFTEAWTFISTVNAPNTEEQGGCGGYLAVLSGFSDAEKEELHGYLETHCESLREWLDIHKEA